MNEEKFNCPVCDAYTTQIGGYGLAAGPMGSYSYCDNCDHLVDYWRDQDGMYDDNGDYASEDERVKAIRVKDDAAFYYHVECSRIQFHGRPW